MPLSPTLRINAVFTGACGLVCLFTPDFVTLRAGVPDRIWVLALGIVLLAYVPILLFAAWQPMAWLVKAIIALDWAYVLIAATFLASHWAQADGVGVMLVAGSTAFVALFAALQQRGLSQALRKE